jgi:hypothetical protein
MSVVSGKQSGVTHAQDHDHRFVRRAEVVSAGAITRSVGRAAQVNLREAHAVGDTRKRIIELMEVTSIGRNGEEVLAEIMDQGAEFISGDVYTKHMLHRMRCKCDSIYIK